MVSWNSLGMWDRRKDWHTEPCFKTIQKGNWPLPEPFPCEMVPKVHLPSDKSRWGRVWMSQVKVTIGHGSVTLCGWVPAMWSALWESISPLKRCSEACSSLNGQHLLPHLSGIILLSNCSPQTFIKHTERQQPSECNHNEAPTLASLNSCFTFHLTELLTWIKVFSWQLKGVYSSTRLYYELTLFCLQILIWPRNLETKVNFIYL